ncbi:MAG: hypothetical protein K0S56_403 [Microvirga sp.]|jgi:hypothetical protein|nr:hypothetical protein [Microvirga sp.]
MGENMSTTVISGHGWLRTAGLGASTACYHLTRTAAGIDGEVLAELATMIEAAGARHATLVLESGLSVRVDVLRCSPAGLAVHVAEGEGEDPRRPLC